MTDTVWLQRASYDVPWGFRITGGRDYQKPLSVQRVTGGSVASTGLHEGDVILRISDTDTSTLTQAHANELIKGCGNLLQLSILRQDGRQGSGHSQVAAKSPGTDPVHNLFKDMYRHTDSPNASGSMADSPRAAPAPAPAPYSYKPYSPQPQQTPTSPPSAINYGQSPDSRHQAPRFPTRLDRQLSDMQLSDQQSPLATPTSGLAGGSPYHSYNKEPSYPDAGYRPSPPKSSHHSPQQPSPQAIPDAILNMAAKGEPDKKPWAYAPDMNVIKQQRDKVRRRVPQKDKQDITQSDVYKMIHETGEPKPKPHVIIPQVNHHPARGPSETDETKFSGLNYRGDIPSKSFHRLQQMTSHPEPEIDTSSIRPNMGENDDQQVGNYDETSIRYMGRNIPSKSFRMLQSMTDGNELTVPQAKPRRRPQPEQEEEPQQDADDIVDIKYVGGAIPSKSFRFLQKTVGEAQEAEPDLEERRERRRSRSRTRRRSRPREEEKPVPATAGGEQLKIGPESILPEQWRAALPQSVAPQVTVATNVKRSEPEPEEEDEETSTFDERAYLAGKIPLVSEGPGKYVPDEVVADLYSAPEAPTQESPEEKAPEFDEDSYLSGKLTLMSVSGQQGEKAPLEKPKREVTPPPPWIRPDVDKEQTDEQFDEEAYKGGRLNIVRKSIDLALPPRLPVTVTSKATTDRAPWQRDEPDVTIQNDAEFDEHAFLYGSSARSQSVPSNEKSAPWTQKEEKPEEEFDESAYLAGRIPVVRDSVDRELDGVAHKTPKVIPLRRQERAVWQRDEDEDTNDSQDVEFDENAYLAGRLPVVRGASVDRSLDSESSQFKKIPSRSFRRLTRSLSTDCANFMGDNDTNQEEEEDPDTIIRKQVPSKAFRCLTRLVDKKAAENDMLMKPFPIDQFERLREKATADESQMNMDQVLEKMNIENTDPSQYLNQLRTTLEDATARIELENEVTEF